MHKTAMAYRGKKAQSSATVKRARVERPPVPFYDSVRREFRLGTTVLRRFKHRAGNQIGVLQAFQNQDWPPRIEDPLCIDPALAPENKLHDTVYYLNKDQSWHF